MEMVTYHVNQITLFKKWFAPLILKYQPLFVTLTVQCSHAQPCGDLPEERAATAQGSSAGLEPLQVGAGIVGARIVGVGIKINVLSFIL